jgi:hypothetical protein
MDDHATESSAPPPQGVCRDAQSVPRHCQYSRQDCLAPAKLTLPRMLIRMRRWRKNWRQRRPETPFSGGGLLPKELPQLAIAQPSWILKKTLKELRRLVAITMRLLRRHSHHSKLESPVYFSN